MAFLDFFWEKAQDLAGKNAQSVTQGINGNLTEISDRLRRIETKQKETSLQLDEVEDFLHSGGSETDLLDAMISLTDIIYDFYYFAAADADSPLFEQAQMMWNTAGSAAETAGLEIIEPGNEPFDFSLHSAESTEQEHDLPNGYVIKTLKCGYRYKDEIIRRALVVINKIKEDEKADIPHIIYL